MYALSQIKLSVIFQCMENLFIHIFGPGPNCGSGDYDSNRELSCHNHLGQTLKFYCEDCETAICASCTDIGHRDHFTKRMAEAVESEKVELRSLVDGAYVQVG